MRLADLRDDQEIVLKHDVTHEVKSGTFTMPAGTYRVRIEQHRIRIHSDPPAETAFRRAGFMGPTNGPFARRQPYFLYLESAWAVAIVEHMELAS